MQSGEIIIVILIKSVNELAAVNQLTTHTLNVLSVNSTNIIFINNMHPL